MKETSFSFPVRTIGLQTADGVEIPGRVAVIRNNKYPIGIVSKKYQLLKHATVVDGFREALEGHKVKEKIEMTKNGARMHYQAILEDVQIEVAKGDFCSLRIIAENSYDGGNSLRITFGAFRLVCSNGMVIGKTFFKFSQRHVGELGLKVDVLQAQIAAMTGQFQKALPVMKEMIRVKVDPRVEGLFDAETLHIPAYLAKAASDEFEKGPKDGWGYYNALTAAITHHMKKENPTLAVKYGQRAWNAAVSLTK